MSNAPTLQLGAPGRTLRVAVTGLALALSALFFQREPHLPHHRSAPPSSPAGRSR